MRSETIAVHSGYVDDPTTHAAAVPIYLIIRSSPNADGSGKAS